MIPRFWEWIEKEAKVLIVFLTTAIALFGGLSVCISWKEFTANQNVREYITGMRKGEYKIDLGKGEYIGAKLLVNDSGTMGWYWKRNTEPSQITSDNAEWVGSMGMTGMGMKMYGQDSLPF